MTTLHEQNEDCTESTRAANRLHLAGGVNSPCPGAVTAIGPSDVMRYLRDFSSVPASTKRSCELVQSVFFGAVLSVSGASLYLHESITLHAERD